MRIDKIEGVWYDSIWHQFINPEALTRLGIARDDIQPKVRAGGYALNGWLVDRPPGFGRWLWTYPFNPVVLSEIKFREMFFSTESRVTFPSQTPFLSDGARPYNLPRATDIIAFRTGKPEDSEWHMFSAIPRHGRRPEKPYPDSTPIWALKSPPGSVNISFLDGHSSLTELSRLWNLQWHYGYLAPEQKP